ncbi:MAG: RIP metalloprotease [Anaerolineae bacterium]
MPATSWIYFLLVFTLLVFVHELGHLIVAKRMGIRIPEFGFGFPPRLLSLGRVGETEITINAIPVGGFVRLAGEDDPDEPGSFAGQSPRVRAAILASGSFMNLVLAAGLFAVVALVGEPSAVIAVEVTQIAPGSPAEAGGLRVGDRILAVDGIQVEDPLDVVRVAETRVGREIALDVERGEESLVVRLVPRRNPPVGEGPMGFTAGAALAGTRIERYDILEAIPHGISRTFQVVGLIGYGIVYMIQGIIAPEVSGPIGIAQMTGQAAARGAPFLLQFTGFLSVNLALLNLLPFPGLDGARLAFVALEAVRGGTKIDPQREGLVHVIGIAILIGLVLVVSYYDLIRVSQG